MNFRRVILLKAWVDNPGIILIGLRGWRLSIAGKMSALKRVHTNATCVSVLLSFIWKAFASERRRFLGNEVTACLW